MESIVVNEGSYRVGMGIDLMMCIDSSIFNDKFYCVLIVVRQKRNVEEAFVIRYMDVWNDFLQCIVVGWKHLIEIRGLFFSCWFVKDRIYDLSGAVCLKNFY